jgi:hypothetical protein
MTMVRILGRLLLLAVEEVILLFPYHSTLEQRHIAMCAYSPAYVHVCHTHSLTRFTLSFACAHTHNHAHSHSLTCASTQITHSLTCASTQITHVRTHSQPHT